MLKDCNLAPGVSFDEAKHEYWYEGKQLSGVTGLISKKLGLKYNQDIVGEHTEEGLHVHKAVAKWIETGEVDSIHQGVRWLTQTFQSTGTLVSEVLVSDFKQYASAIDVVEVVDNRLILYDIKKGKFNRDYCTWQLSIYKYFIEKFADYRVIGCNAICLKDREIYPVFSKSAEQVEKLLYS